jgi:ketosteroid isomerase-like protein
MNDQTIDAVLAAETARCAAIRSQDFSQLTMLLHPSLTHVHARGNQDTRESYIKYLREVIEILDVKREDLKVSIYGDCAVMTGRQINTARARRAEPILTIESQTMQVWFREEGRWRQVAFQATPIGTPPPPVPLGSLR